MCLLPKGKVLISWSQDIQSPFLMALGWLEVAFQGENPKRDSSLARGLSLAVTMCLKQGDDK